MSNKIDTFSKISNLPKILESATLLYNLGLQTEKPYRTVGRYLKKNPDINKTINTYDKLEFPEIV